MEISYHNRPKTLFSFDSFTLEGTDRLDKQKIPSTVETV